jgi:hypothetical protein
MDQPLDHLKMLVARVGADGSLLGSWTIGGSGKDTATSIAVTAAGVAVAGYGTSPSPLDVEDAILVQLPLSMDSLVTRSWGSGWWDGVLDMERTGSGAFLLGLGAYQIQHQRSAGELHGNPDRTLGTWQDAAMTVEPLGMVESDIVNFQPMDLAIEWLDASNDLKANTLVLDAARPNRFGELCVINVE